VKNPDLLFPLPLCPFASQSFIALPYMRIALINTNRMQPPVAPIGLDYVDEALNAAGHSVDVLDLCWEDNPESAIAKFLKTGFIDLAKAVKENSDAPIVLGGVGFSVLTEQILTLSNADFGVWGE
jgi:hypothetical protein